MSDRMGAMEAIEAAERHECGCRGFMESSCVIFSLVFEFRCRCGWAVNFNMIESSSVYDKRVQKFRHDRVGFLAELSGLLVVKNEVGYGDAKWK